MGPIEAELRIGASCTRNQGAKATYMPYVFFSGVAAWGLTGNAQGLLWNCARRIGLSIHDEESWSEAIEAAEALGL